MEHVTSGAQLQHNVDMFFILIGSIRSNNMPMCANAPHDIDFSPNPVSIPIRQYCSFTKHLYSATVTTFPMDAFCNNTERALSQRLLYLIHRRKIALVGAFQYHSRVSPLLQGMLCFQPFDIVAFTTLSGMLRVRSYWFHIALLLFCAHAAPGSTTAHKNNGKKTCLVNSLSTHVPSLENFPLLAYSSIPSHCVPTNVNELSNEIYSET
mmetsp:Transcript_31218/g.120154  ORF Transcript_31218/g.120154 Transcript_31218/m.120154 type:complete len:209 (+) Transcript_31218:1489-2115(+)